MPVQVDIPAAFAAGQILAMVGRESLKTGQHSVLNRFLLWTNWYMTLVFAPTCLFLLAGWPGWETLYQWAWVENPQFHSKVAFFYIAFFILLVILANAGFLMVYWLIRHNRDTMAKVILTLSVILVPAAPFWIDIKAPFYIGTYQQYHAGSASFIFGPSFISSYFGIIAILLFWLIGSAAFVKKVYLEDISMSYQSKDDCCPDMFHI